MTVKVRIKKVKSIGDADYYITEDGRLLVKGSGDSLRELRCGGGLAVAGKRDYIGQLTLDRHLA